MHIIRNILIFICFVALAVSFWPGLLQSYTLAIILLGMFIICPVLAISLIIILMQQWKHHHSLDFSELKVLRLVSVFLIVATLITFDLPARATIYLNKESIIHECKSKVDVTNVGMFPVHSLAINENGLYLVTLQHGDGLGPDIVSHGIFCGKPNDSTPFGSARGGYRWVTSNIYYFSVSNDY